MDGHDFDEMLRRFMEPRSRRGLARTLGGALAILGVPALTHWTAPAVQAKKKCKGGKIRCHKRCIDPKSDAAHCGGCKQSCPAERPVCTDGTCSSAVCPIGFTRCGDDCVDTDADFHHCGTCEQACEAGQEVCSAGACAAICPAGAQFCTDEPNIACGIDCYCVTGKSRGTICGGRFSAAPCAPCEADADCDAVTGPGSVCLDVVGECFCDTGPVFPTACMGSCPG